MIQNKQKQNHLKTQKKHSQPQSELTFLEHFYELRKRLFWVVLSLVITSAAGFQYKDQLISAVMAPLHGEKLVYLTPAGGFSFIFTLSLYFGVLVSIPVIVYNIYRFLQPILRNTSRRFVASFIILSVCLAATGASFGYFVTIPAALNFLSNFAGGAVIPSLTAESYLSFVVAYILGLAALFQVPLLLFLFDHVKPIPPGMLSGTQRFVIIAATIIAAVITPTPDAVNMMIVAVPLVAIYEVGVLAVFMRHRFSHQRVAKQQIIEVPKETTVAVDAVHEPLTQTIGSPSAIPVPIRPVQKRQYRTMDGMIQRPAAQAITVPARQEVIRPRAAVGRPVIARPLRSIDGLSLV